ncbi:unnamed protein product [Symbiodinium pilosum]|uniref:Uncharacterized protein n=1 Tax=Symbiodinium pilosum TaxID=2952 RepID=A0A812QB25_SYMPI|nr:unnamed protein product [Symbiodinium pilosum]
MELYRQLRPCKSESDFGALAHESYIPGKFSDEQDPWISRALSTTPTACKRLELFHAPTELQASFANCRPPSPPSPTSPPSSLSPSPGRAPQCEAVNHHKHHRPENLAQCCTMAGIKSFSKWWTPELLA